MERHFLIGLSMENYVPLDVMNATIQVLEGQVELAVENGTRHLLNVGNVSSLPSNVMHTVTTTSSFPACYMYTFVGQQSNSTVPENDKKNANVTVMTPFAKSFALVGQSLLNLVFGIPLVTHKWFISSIAYPPKPVVTFLSRTRWFIFVSDFYEL